MKNFLKSAILTVALVFGPCLLAVQPPDVGHFKGLAFSSATDRHPVEINGGNLVGCEIEPDSEITRCEVKRGSVVVTGTEWNNLTVKLARVSVLRTTGKTPTRHYYFRGTADLMIGEQTVVAKALVTVNQDSTPD